MKRQPDRVRSELLAKLTHELHTPLVAMQHALALLKDEVDGPLSEEQREYVAVTIRNLERLKGLISDLLDLLTPDAKNPPLKPPAG